MLSKQILEATQKMKEDIVAKCVDQIHEDFFSLNEYNSENALSQVINLSYFYAYNDYLLDKELQAGKGRADIVFRVKMGKRRHFIYS